MLYGYTFKILIGDDFFKLEIESELFKIEIDFLKDQARFFMIMGALFYFRARFLSFVDQLLSLYQKAQPLLISNIKKNQQKTSTQTHFHQKSGSRFFAHTFYFLIKKNSLKNLKAPLPTHQKNQPLTPHFFHISSSQSTPLTKSKNHTHTPL